MRVVLDTNVLISAFKDEYSYEKKVIDEVVSGHLEAFANKQTVRENRLLLKEVVGNDDYKRELENYFARVTDVPNPRAIRVVQDPEDNKILESAVEAKADYLITNDRDLLSLGSYGVTKVVTPAHFWATYKDEGMDLWRRWADYLKNT